MLYICAPEMSTPRANPVHPIARPASSGPGYPIYDYVRAVHARDHSAWDPHTTNCIHDTRRVGDTLRARDSHGDSG